MTEGGLYCIYV